MGRYAFEGEPLLYTQQGEMAAILSKNQVPRCEQCGSVRVFELQLMPTLMDILQTSACLEEEDRNTSEADVNRSQPPCLAGMEWGTLCVYACSSSCYQNMSTRHAWSWNETRLAEEYIQELVLVQQEPE